MYYVVDTHAFIWYLADDSKLSRSARDIFDAAGRGEITLIIPAVVLLECIDIFDKKKVRLSFEELILKLSQANNFIVSEITWTLILETNRVKGLVISVFRNQEELKYPYGYRSKERFWLRGQLSERKKVCFLWLLQSF